MEVHIPLVYYINCQHYGDGKKWVFCCGAFTDYSTAVASLIEYIVRNNFIFNEDMRNEIKSTFEENSCEELDFDELYSFNRIFGKIKQEDIETLDAFIQFIKKGINGNMSILEAVCDSHIDTWECRIETIPLVVGI